MVLIAYFFAENLIFFKVDARMKFSFMVLLRIVQEYFFRKIGNLFQIFKALWRGEIILEIFLKKFSADQLL